MNTKGKHVASKGHHTRVAGHDPIDDSESISSLQPPRLSHDNNKRVTGGTRDVIQGSIRGVEKVDDNEQQNQNKMKDIQANLKLSRKEYDEYLRGKNDAKPELFPNTNHYKRTSPKATIAATNNNSRGGDKLHLHGDNELKVFSDTTTLSEIQGTAIKVHISGKKKQQHEPINVDKTYQPARSHEHTNISSLIADDQDLVHHQRNATSNFDGQATSNNAIHQDRQHMYPGAVAVGIASSSESNDTFDYASANDVENQHSMNNNQDKQGVDEDIPLAAEVVPDDRTIQNAEIVRSNLNLNDMEDRLGHLEQTANQLLHQQLQQQLPMTPHNQLEIKEGKVQGDNIKDNTNAICNNSKRRRCGMFAGLFLLLCIIIIVVVVIIVLISSKQTTPNPTTPIPTILATEPIMLTTEPTTPKPAPTPIPTTPKPALTPIPTSPKPTTPEPTFPKWVQVGNDIDGLNVLDTSGTSVSMSALGDIVVVGAPASYADRPGSTQVYILDSSTDKWNLIDKTLVGTSTASKSDRFGAAVSTSKDGSVIAIGAPYKNSRTGSVYIYYLNTITNTVEFIQKLKGDNKDDYFGTSVDVSGDGSTIIVGANCYDIDSKSYTGPGYAKVYHKDDSNSNNNDNLWSQLGNTISGKKLSDDEFFDEFFGESVEDGDGFGGSVSISNDGNIVAIGAPDWDWFSGYVEIYQYKKSSNKWVDYGNDKYYILTGDIFETFGDAISLSSDGNIVAVGAPGSDGINYDKWACGTVKVFQINPKNNNWEQLGSNIDGENDDDNSGAHESVKLSDDGMIVAIGSPGNYTGSVRIFEYDSKDQWIQISQDIDGEAEDDTSGFSISLSGDGSIVAIGADWNDGNDDFDSDRGHVRVYRRGDK